MKKLAAGMCISFAALVLFPVTGPAASTSDENGRFRARLVGFEEVPAVSTDADGRLWAKVKRGSEAISYRLQYEDLEGEVLFAHIHFGQWGVNGGVAAFLCGGDHAPACPQEGTIDGTIEASDVVGPADQGIDPGEFDELVAAMEAGVTYANVHSERFPNGEIRGQIHNH